MQVEIENLCEAAASFHARGLVHLHSTWAVALSCLEGLDAAAPMPVFTPYYSMRMDEAVDRAEIARVYGRK